jgi:hypothetical protein
MELLGGSEREQIRDWRGDFLCDFRYVRNIGAVEEGEEGAAGGVSLEDGEGGTGLAGGGVPAETVPGAAGAK